MLIRRTSAIVAAIAATAAAIVATLSGTAAMVGTAVATAITAIAITATIVVSLPAEAKLTIDGNATISTSARRVFTSPNLEMGQEYVYSLRAEITRDGQIVAETQTVTVRAGAEIPVQFTMTSQGIATR